MAAESPIRFAFAFGCASGHINPSLPVARALVQRGHEVQYLSRAQMQAAIEDTGASFRNELVECPELFDGRKEDLMGAMEALKGEYGLQEDPMMLAWSKLMPISLELEMAGIVRWLRRFRPQVLVFCPMINRAAFFAAKFLGIPMVPILTMAGPGSVVGVINQFLAMTGMRMEEVVSGAKTFGPTVEAVARLWDNYGADYPAEWALSLEITGAMSSLAYCPTTIVTTIEDMQDPVPANLADYYRAAGTSFAHVGPLLDQKGAYRAAGHKFTGVCAQAGEAADPLQELLQARAAGRRVVLASMGTVITGDSPDFGWAVKPQETQGIGLTGKQLCQAAWAGVFDAFGAKEGDAMDQTALLLVSVGPQQDSLENMQVPANALCLPRLPQVDLLRAGVDVFLTHGGQNSFMESISAGVPVVVCPGFGDQPANAQKAADLGVGVQVVRPIPQDGEEEAAAAVYRAQVAQSLLKVVAEDHFRSAAAAYGERIQKAGGVDRAVEILVQTAARAAKEATEATEGGKLPTLLGADAPAAVEQKTRPAQA